MPNKDKTNIIVIGAKRHLDSVFGSELERRLPPHTTLLGVYPMAEGTVAHWPQSLNEADLVLATWGMPPLKEEDLCRAHRLRGIFYAAGSMKGLVDESFWERSITVSTASIANAIPVAEYCLAMTLLANKKVLQAVCENKRRQTWPEYPITGFSMGSYGRTVGIISLGATARCFIRLLQSTDLKIAAWSPELTPQSAVDLGVQAEALEGIFTKSDLVSIHSPLLPSTAQFITGEHVCMMRSGATLINTSRGAVLDQASVLDALRDRPDLTAILDVTDPEPPISGSALFDLPNVFTTPHLSGSQGNERKRCGDFALAELSRYLRDEPLLNELHAEQVAASA